MFLQSGVYASSPIFHQPCDTTGLAIVRAQIKALEALRHRRRGEPVPNVGTLNPARTTIDIPRSKSGVITLHEAVAGYVAANPGWTHKTRQQCETSLRLLCEHIGVRANLEDVGRQQLSAFRDKLSRLSPNWARSSRSRGLHLDRLTKEFSVGAGQHGLTHKTLTRHLSPIRGMFEWARDVGIYEGQNPVTVGTKRTNRNSDAPSTRTDYDRFTDKEVISLFEGLQFVADPQAHTHDTAMPWIMVLAAYSGMRLEEVCGLGVKELGEEDGIWRFDLSGRRLKTESAERKVPFILSSWRRDFSNIANGSGKMASSTCFRAWANRTKMGVEAAT